MWLALSLGLLISRSKKGLKKSPSSSQFFSTYFKTAFTFPLDSNVVQTLKVCSCSVALETVTGNLTNDQSNYSDYKWLISQHFLTSTVVLSERVLLLQLLRPRTERELVVQLLVSL